MNIFEVLAKPFMKDNTNNNTTVQTDIEKQDIIIDDSIPDPKSNKNNYQRDTYVYDKVERETSRIKSYRELTIVPEVSSGIDEIINEAITKGLEETIKPKLYFNEDNKQSDIVKKTYIDAFDYTLKLLDFENRGYELFYKWFVDSKLIGELIYEKNNTSKGIQAINIISPLYLAYIYDDRDGKYYYKYVDEKFKYIKDEDEFYDREQIVCTNSGLKSADYTYDIGYLEYTLKAVNNMKSIEDSLVIYRYLRAGDKRIWNIPIGKLAKSKAENFITKVMNTIKFNKQYDRETGEIINSTSVESIVDDWVFPNKNGEKIEVDTLSGDTAFLSDLNDHELFLKKLYIALKLPVNRLSDTSTLDFSGEDIIQQELKFIKHIKKLRNKFQQFLLDITKMQLISTNKITQKEWNETKNEFKILWNDDNNILEKVLMKNYVEKVTAMSELEASGILGKYVSHTNSFKTVFGYSDEDIKEERKQIEKDKKIFSEPVEPDFEDEDEDEDEENEKEKDTKKSKSKDQEEDE